MVDVSPYRDARTWRLSVTYNLPDAKPRTAGLIVGIDRGITTPDGRRKIRRERRLP